MKLILSPWNDPRRNVALEEYLMTERPGEDVLLLYINAPSVIVGRHQLIEAEVDTAYCAREGIAVVRRLSGGGTVYHDPGNINYAFVVDKGELPALDRDFTGPVIRALRALGVEARAGERRELLCEGLKISGTASHITRDRILFHGTLLHRADLGRLAKALRGDGSLRGKAVASVPSPVANLSEWTGGEESTPEFLERLCEVFIRQFDLPGLSPLSEDEKRTVFHREKLREKE